MRGWGRTLPGGVFMVGLAGICAAAVLGAAVSAGHEVPAVVWAAMTFLVVAALLMWRPGRLDYSGGRLTYRWPMVGWRRFNGSVVIADVTTSQVSDRTARYEPGIVLADSHGGRVEILWGRPFGHRGSPWTHPGCCPWTDTKWMSDLLEAPAGTALDPGVRRLLELAIAGK